MEKAADEAAPPASGGATGAGSSAGSGTSPVSASAGGQESQNGTLALVNQISIAASATQAAIESSASNSEVNQLKDRSIAALRLAMVGAGIDPDSVKMTYSSEYTWTPDGGRVNNFLTVETDKGRKLGFSAELSLDNPQVTLCDVRHMLDGTAGWDQLDQAT